MTGDPPTDLRQLGETLRAADDNAAWSAMAQLVEVLAPVLRRRLRYLTDDEIDDATVDAMTDLFQRRRKLRPDTVAGYFVATARGHALHALQRKAREVELREQPERPRPRGGAHDPAVQQALAAIDEVDAAILQAFARHGGARGWSREVANRFELTANAVRVRKHRAQAKLRDLLAAMGIARAPHDEDHRA